MTGNARLVLLVAGVTALLSACVVGPRPRNPPESAWMLQQAPRAQVQRCAVPSLPTELERMPQRPVAAVRPMTLLLAAGDRLRLRIPNDEDRLTGLVEIADDGTVALPGIAPIRLAGLPLEAARARLARVMTQAGLLRAVGADGMGLLDLRLVESAGVSVAVSGAVFAPGLIRAGERAAEVLSSDRQANALGDANPARSVAVALRSAGGVRPDADLSHIYLVRDGAWSVLDLNGVAAGSDPDFVPVTAGDRLLVPSLGCFQPGLVRPTAVTLPGIRVFMSNLTQPASNNASSAIGAETTSLPYGTRMLQALVAMNCVGGSFINAHRHAVLISSNPINGESIVVERAIEHLVRGADRDAINPYLMPADALACYDSRLTNLRAAIDFLSVPAGLATPLILLRRTRN